MNLVVSNASPIRYLVIINAIHVLPKLFDKVIIPEHVINIELQSTKTPPPVRFWAKNLPSWVEVRKPTKTEDLNLHSGEEQAIALALELGTPILIDEKEARNVAQRRGIIVIGTIALIERAAAKDLLNIEQVLTDLQKTNMRLHRSLIEGALSRHIEKRSKSTPPKAPGE